MKARIGGVMVLLMVAILAISGMAVAWHSANEERSSSESNLI